MEVIKEHIPSALEHLLSDPKFNHNQFIDKLFDSKTPKSEKTFMIKMDHL